MVNALLFLLGVLSTISPMIAAKSNSCFQAVFIKAKWTDHRPEFMVNMTFLPPGSISSTTVVNTDIAEPISKISLVQQDGNNTAHTLYNVTVKLCDILTIAKKTPMIDAIYQQSQRSGNYSFDCPMRRGVYVLENLRIGKTNPLLGFMYGPKRTFTFIGGLYSNLENNTLMAWSTYFIRMKIVRKWCD